MTISFEGLKDIKDDLAVSVTTAEKTNPEVTMITEGASSALLGITGLLAIKSGIVRLANNEATYGGFGPIFTAAAGVGSLAGAVAIGKRSLDTYKYLRNKRHKKVVTDTESTAEAE